MGTVLGDIIPLAIGVALSPLPIVAVILMLFSKNPRGPALAFWPVGFWASRSWRPLSSSSPIRPNKRPAARIFRWPPSFASCSAWCCWFSPTGTGRSGPSPASRSTCPSG